MKKTIGWLCASMLFVTACTKEKTYEIVGVWEGGDGEKVYLQQNTERQKFEDIDSTVVQGGTFRFTGPYIGDQRGLRAGTAKCRLLLEEQPVQAIVKTTQTEVDGKTVTKQEIEIKGSDEQKCLREGYDMLMTRNFMKLATMFTLSKVADDEVKFDSVSRSLSAISDVIDQELKQLLDTTTHLAASAFIIRDVVLPDYPFEEAVRYYERLTPQAKASYPGTLLKQRIDEMSSVNVGGTAPEIELSTPDGQTVRLSDFRGKYVLLDFWASWCGPCLAEAPNVKAIYEQYHDKGFEVFGVSLDEKAELWTKAIEKHGLHWTHVSSLKGWECPVAKRYGVTGIPKMFLLDPQGKIIATDLRGEALRKKVEEVIK